MKLKIILLGLLAALAPSAAFAQCSVTGNLDGMWKSNDGGSYYIREIGTDVWWLGVSADGGATFTNVYKGSRDGDRITGQWADVRGRAANHGTLNLVISGGSSVTRIETAMMTGGFSGTTWYRTCNDNPAQGENGSGQAASNMVRMPYVFGRSRGNASAILSGLGLKPVFTGGGAIVSEQSPGPGVSVAPGSYVQIRLQPVATTVRVPDMIGRRMSDAAATLNGLGLRASIMGDASGFVHSQSLVAGTMVVMGTMIQLAP